MTKKLIQTNFVYQAAYYGKSMTKATGSYLGRAPATVETIRKHLRKTAEESGVGTENVKYGEVVVTGSHVSQWIA